MHINTTMTYHDRQLKVCALTVLDGDHEFDNLSSLTVEPCNGFNQIELDSVLSRYDHNSRDRLIWFKC